MTEMTIEEASELSKGFSMNSKTLVKDMQDHFMAKGFISAYEQQQRKIEILEIRLASKCEMHVDYGSPIDIKLEQLEEKLRVAWQALKLVDDWFELLKKDQQEKLVIGQTLESASDNWGKLEHQSFDMEIIKDAIRRIGHDETSVFG